MSEIDKYPAIAAALGIGACEITNKTTIATEHRTVFKNMSVKIVAMTLLIMVVTMMSGCNNSTEPTTGTGESLRFIFMAYSLFDTFTINK